ncbi:MAG TPA: hypothetical protein PKA82_18255 [Pyrinomonadaceae bacterium]|nr:hypothetical protein [Pyrinomonadaceae bacterium]
MDDLGGYVADDDLAIEPLNEHGIAVETLSWRQTTREWSEFDLVVIRTPWDYQREPSVFLEMLDAIEDKTRLANPASIARWNFDKHYLLELHLDGIEIVPTIWDAAYTADNFAKWQDAFMSETLIVKPTVSATAEHTYKLSAFDASFQSIFDERSFLVQPFLESIITEGEFSLFFFNGEYSHTILKAPKTDDFRVQEEHGGIITAVRPEPTMLTTATAILGRLSETLLYARVDVVRYHGQFALMELELIEPALYLRMDDAAPRRFARAINEALG